MNHATRTMKITPVVRLALAAGLLAVASAAEKKASSKFPAGNRAVIVVTGLRLDEDPDHAVKDLAAAEGATVRVTARNGKPEEKPTRRFGREGKSGEKFFTADFGVELDASYEITMTFRDGTIIRVDDFLLPADWKTHFYFHSTRGTLSTASILRVGTDPASRLRCHIYAVFPVAAYRELGGDAEL